MSILHDTTVTDRRKKKLYYEYVVRVKYTCVYITTVISSYLVSKNQQALFRTQSADMTE
jgi:hypothetical protein